jgi:hypothetical protein
MQQSQPQHWTEKEDKVEIPTVSPEQGERIDKRIRRPRARNRKLLVLGWSLLFLALAVICREILLYFRPPPPESYSIRWQELVSHWSYLLPTIGYIVFWTYGAWEWLRIRT